MKHTIYRRMLRGIFLLAILICCFTVTVSAAESNQEELPYEVIPGSEYFETASNFGDGRHATVSESNPFANTPCYAGRDGWAFLDENGYVIDSDYDPGEHDIAIPAAPEGTKEIWVHFHTEEYRNGWTKAENLVQRTPQELTPSEIVQSISEVVSTEEETVLLLDVSGSMSDNQQEVLDLLDSIDLSNTQIIVFGTTHQTVTQEQLRNSDYDVAPGGSNLWRPLYYIAESTTLDHLIIISDLCHNISRDLPVWSEGFTARVTIYDPSDDPGNDSKILESMAYIWPNAKVDYNLIQ